MTVKLEVNKKMVGQAVGVHDDSWWEGIVERVVDEETFLVKDIQTLEVRRVSIFDIRSVV